MANHSCPESRYKPQTTLINLIMYNIDLIALELSYHSVIDPYSFGLVIDTIWKWKYGNNKIS